METTNERIAVTSKVDLAVKALAMGPGQTAQFELGDDSEPIDASPLGELYMMEYLFEQSAKNRWYILSLSENGRVLYVDCRAVSDIK
jgi:hypothetical protein